MTSATARPDTAGRGPETDAGRTARSSRHPGDALRVGLGLAGLLISLLAIQRDRLTTFEVDLFRLVNDLPDAVSWVLGPVMEMGNVLAAPVTAVVAVVVVRRNRRIAIDIVVAGVLAWYAAKVVKDLVGRPRPGGLVDDVFRLAGTEGLGFVSGHTAVATAIVAAASPYLTRRIRRAVWAVPLLVGLARIYYGAHLPLDIVGGAAVGWTVAAALHLALGAPRRVPTLADAELALRATGIPVSTVEQLDTVSQGSFPFVAHAPGATRFVKLLDPEPRDRDWVYRAARFLAFRDVRDEAAIDDPRTQAHREAAMTLLAQVNGARVPTILAIEAAGARVWIIEDHVDGTMLDRLPVESLTDDLLDGLWQQVACLRRGRIAHRDLVASNVLVDGRGDPWIVDFAHATSTTRDRALDNDVAELLVTTGLLVGAGRAVDAARRVLGAEAVEVAAAELQPFVLTAENRGALRDRRDLLGALRSAASPSTPQPDRAARPTPVQVAVTIGLAIGVPVALVTTAGSGEVGDVLADAGLRWLGLAALCVVVLPIAGAATLLAGIDRRLALGRTSGEILALRTRTALAGRAAGRAVLEGRLRRSGVPSAEAATAVHRWTLVHTAVAVAGGVVFAVAAGLRDGSWSFPSEAGVVAAVLAVALAVEAGLDRRQRPAGISSTDRRAVTGLTEPFRTVGTAMVEVAIEVLATVAIVRAMGGSTLVVSLCLVATLVSVLRRLGPVGGAPGTGCALLALGLVVVGVPVPVAASAAVAAQVLLVWTPVVGGALRTTVGARW